MEAMTLLRPVLCIYLGLVLSIAYTTVFGPLGVQQRVALERRERALEENLASLERINTELAEELRSLSSDPETVALLARDLGYYRPGEHRVSVDGLPQRKEGRAIGQLVAAAADTPGREGTLRLALLGFPLAAWTLLRLTARLVAHGSTARRS
jgi:cell division protein FtsB